MRNGILALFVVASLVAGSAAIASQNNSKPAFKPGELVVKLKSSSKGISAKGFTNILAARAHQLQESVGRAYAVTVKPFIGDRRFVSMKVNTPAPMDQILATVNRSSDIEYAEPNYLYYASGVAVDPVKAVIPNDPDFGLNWGLLNVGQKDKAGKEGIPGVDIGATKAWAYTTGSHKISVAVIDTGVDYLHDELRDNIMVNTAEIAGNGVDDDGNGYIDDIHGWNFVANNNDPMDDHSHGTHCSGTIGAKGDNGIGTAGVNWNVSILPLKFLDAEGSGSLENAVAAIKYATKRGVKLMSNSWGGGGYSQALYDAIAEAKAAGILFVAAAGNESNNNDANPGYPASYELDNVISVAATDNRDVKASWSNYGRKSVHLAAPGVAIYSTVPRDKGNYGYMSGTSMACPHVSGAAALLWSTDEKMTYAKVKETLLASVDPVPSLRTRTITSGRLNVYNAISGYRPAPLPTPPADGWVPVAYSLESKHPYDDKTDERFQIMHAGAKFIRLHFARVDLERNYDYVRVRGADGDLIAELTGSYSDYMTDYVAGDQVTIEFTSDSIGNDFGFAIDRYEVIQ